VPGDGFEPAGGAGDRECVRRARRGDHEAFRALVERYQGRAYRLALRILRNEEAARDAVQEAFLKAYTSLARFEERSSFYTWFYRLVMNQSIDMRRRERAAQRVAWDEGRPIERAALEPAAGAEPSAAPDASDSLERKEVRERVGAAIEALPPAARETLLLREVDGLSYAEIAKVLEIPRGTVMSRLHYARRRVQEALRRTGVEAPTENATGGAR
jgi:RNA polymerase sigma-70 factor (ECF subfamily)